MITLTIPPDGTQIIMGSTFGNVYFVSYPELNLVQKFQISKEPIKHLSHDTTGNIILCTNKVDEIFIINRNAPESYSSLTFIAHQSEMLKALFLYQDEQIVSVDKDRKMHFWDLPTETELFHIQLPVPSMSDAVTDFDCYCESYNNCIFAVGLRNNKVAVHQFSVE
jgi:WD40 repeat protein